MKRKILIVFFSIAIAKISNSQIDTTLFVHNNTYIELAGPGGFASLNYERIIFNKYSYMLAIRAGLSTYHIKDFTNKFNPDLLLPLSINGCYGFNHKIEIGLGETFANIIYTDETNFKPTRRTNLHTFFSIGYRYQKNKRGLIFRCAYTPIIELNSYLKHWAGISIGYSF